MGTEKFEYLYEVAKNVMGRLKIVETLEEEEYRWTRRTSHYPWCKPPAATVGKRWQSKIRILLMQDDWSPEKLGKIISYGVERNARAEVRQSMSSVHDAESFWALMPHWSGRRLLQEVAATVISAAIADLVNQRAQFLSSYDIQAMSEEEREALDWTGVSEEEREQIMREKVTDPTW